MDVPRESSLKRLQAGYGRLFERYPMPMLVVNLTTLRLMAANEAAARCYGYSVQQLTDMHLPDIYFEEDHKRLPAYMALDAKACANQRRWRHRGRDGRTIDVELNAEDMQLHGMPTRMLLISDVTPAQTQPSVPPSVRRLDDGFFMLDHDARFTQVNQAAQALLQIRGSDLLGRTLWECCPQSNETSYQALYACVAWRREPVCFEFFFELRQVWLEVHAFACADGVAAYFRDVTQRHQNGQRLAQERERLNAIVEASSEAIITVDLGGCVQTFNPGAERVFGYTREQMLGRSIHQLTPERFRNASGQDPARMMGLGRAKGLRADGHEIDLEGSVVPVTIGHERVLIATLRDITVREQMDAERQAARKQLSNLAHRLMSQEKDLVKRIAQALHDQLGQTTAAIRIIHDTMGVLRRGKESREYLRLDAQLGRLIDQATRQVRKVLVDLHPPLLDEHGLAAALDNELHGRAVSQNVMNFILKVPPETQDLRWPASVEYAAFMIAREAIENAVRHSQATVVTVSLNGDSGRMKLDITDNGLGMSAKPQSRAGHLGITGMLERANSIDGSLTVGAAEPVGTCVRLLWKPGP